MRLHGECHVVEDGEIREQRCDLERAGKTELAAAIGRQRGDVVTAESDAAGVRSELARELADQCALARTIWSDDGMKLAGGDKERNVVGRYDAAEAFAHVLDMQQSLSPDLHPPAHRRFRPVRTPPRAERPDP